MQVRKACGCALSQVALRAHQSDPSEVAGSLHGLTPEGPFWGRLSPLPTVTWILIWVVATGTMDAGANVVRAIGLFCLEGHELQDPQGKSQKP